MKSKSNKSKKSVGVARYTPDQIKAIVAFMRGGKTAQEAKKKFGCSAHFAGKKRAEAGVKKVTPVKASKPTKAKKAKGKKAAKGSDLI